MAEDDGGSDQRGSSSSQLTQPKNKGHFASIRIQKGTNFPPLFKKQGGIAVKLDAGDGGAWRNKVTGWLGAHGMKAVFALANSLVKLNEEGTRVLTNYPDDPAKNDFGANGTGMLETLIIVSESDFGRSISLPKAEALLALPEDEVNKIFHDFVRISEQISYHLTTSATAENSLSFMIPDIFDSPDCASRTGSVSHPHAGFIQLLQIEKRLNRDPQGTVLQMKAKLLSDITQRTFQGEVMTMHNLGPIVQQISMRLANILQKQPALKVCTEMEVNAALNSSVRDLCRETTKNSHKNPRDLVDATEFLTMELTQKTRTLGSMDWATFSTDLLSMLATYLPLERIVTKEKDNVTDAVALHANSSYEDRQKRTSSKPQDHARADWTSWTCGTCGNKGHHQSTCTNPPNPKAAKMVILAKEEAAAKRKERLHLKSKRKRIQEASEQSSGNEACPPSLTKKNSQSKHSGSKDKPVTAGLARLNLHDDAHEGCRSNGKAEYCGNAVCKQNQDDSTTALMITLACMPIILGITAYVSPAIAEGIKLCILRLASTMYAAGLPVADSHVHATISESLRAYTPLLLEDSCLVLAFFMLCMLVHHVIKRMHCTPMKASMMHQAMAVLGLGKDFDALRAVLIDSGCTKSVFRNKDKLINLRIPEHNYVILRVSGKLPVTHVGDFPVALKHKNGSVTVRLITGCLYRGSRSICQPARYR
jgi:hypothetical protein